jgi:thiol:disulfide interchange protein DsbD
VLVGGGAVPLPATAAPAVVPRPPRRVQGAVSQGVDGGKAAPLRPASRFTPCPNQPPPTSRPRPPPAPAGPPQRGRPLEAALKSGKLLVILPLFALLGLGLSFTPCVLPMVPILSSIIVGEGAQSSRSRGLLLSATYSLGMAIVYTALGVAAGLAGEGLAAHCKTVGAGQLCLLMALLSLSMFGFYELQVPAALQSKLSTVSNRQAPASWPACS